MTMDLSDFIDDFDDESEAAERRRLAQEKSYEIIEHLDNLEDRVEQMQKRGAKVGSRAPSIFVGQGSYPNVTTGILSPVGGEEEPAEYVTDSSWYANGLDIDSVLQYRTGLLNAGKRAEVNVNDVWDGFVGTQREVALAQEPVDLELGLNTKPKADLSLSDVTTPTGPQAEAGSAKLTENPYVPRAIEKTLEDDDWQATGAMEYLYDKGFDVYEISEILSAGALGEGENRRLVPTRWSITAVDDTLGETLRNRITTNQSIAKPELHVNSFMGNNYWVLLVPGQWEFELVEMKAVESVWNPNGARTYLASAYEGYTGRTSYVDETAGAYYAARLGVLEHLLARDRQAKALVLREVTDAYWAPVGVWQVRESVRNTFTEDPAIGQSMSDVLTAIEPRLPVSLNRLKAKSELAAGVQLGLDAFE